MSEELTRAHRLISEYDKRVLSLESGKGKSRNQGRGGKEVSPGSSEEAPFPEKGDEEDRSGSLRDGSNRKDSLSEASTSEAPQRKTLYAKNNSAEYLSEVSTNAEAAKYRISFDPKTKQGTFALIDLKKIISDDNFRSIIELRGTLTLEEASRYDILEEGLCEATSAENMWKVTRKLVLKLR